MPLARNKWADSRCSRGVDPQVLAMQQKCLEQKFLFDNYYGADLLLDADDNSEDGSEGSSDADDNSQQSGNGSVAEDNNFYQNASDSEDEDQVHGQNATTDYGQIDHQIRHNFKQYVHYAENNVSNFTEVKKTALKLMAVLRKSKASLDTYDAVMEWHLRVSGILEPRQALGNCTSFVSRPKMFKYLQDRYNRPDEYWCYTERITLPSTKSRVDMVLNNALAVIQSLLTDPRINDEDYLFFNNDPFCPPPDDLNYVADLNTGRAYVETYKHLITKPGKQILLPVLFYIDSAVTGQFTDLPVTAVRISLGIFNRRARDQDRFWGTLGMIPENRKEKSRGRRLMIQSGHADGAMLHQDMLEDEGMEDDNDVHKAQDFHTMLKKTLESFLTIQGKGFIWDLMYGGKLYKDVEFVLFCPFIRADTDEADKICGSYTCRTGGVSQLCRYCTCPTDKTDDVHANYPPKTPQMIHDLVEAGDEAALKNLSQQNINNAMYYVRFGLHNATGVHGAIPMEMLHALLLGMVKYTRDCFFEQIGKDSHLADDINGLAKEYGALFARNSDRDLPKTRFGKGIQAGKLQAKEFRGVLLCMAAILVSTKGKQLLSQRVHFRGHGIMEDWLMLVETLLCWESWLKSDKMMVKDVKRAEKKHRYIMYLLKKIGKRTKGMGLKIIKFHGIVHMAQDILNCGVPMEFDTGSNESGHKRTKKSAILTQKNEDTFDYQTAKRLQELDLIDLSQAEMDGKVPWDYYQTEDRDTPMPNNEQIPPCTGGAVFECYYDEDNNPSFELKSRIKEKGKVVLEQPLVEFVLDLQDAVSEHIKHVLLRTEHKRNGDTIFRAHSYYRGGVWRDWVVVDWDDWGLLPNKIWGFVDLSALPQNSGIDFGGLSNLQPATYAIVETAEEKVDDNLVKQPDLFTRILKDVEGIQNGRIIGNPHFYLADCDAFVRPLAVIPNIGGQPNEYFAVTPRSRWRDNFMEWLRLPHNQDIMCDDNDGDIIENNENYDSETEY